MCEWLGVNTGSFCVIKAKFMVINETLNYSAFIINIFGTPKVNYDNSSSPSSMKGEGSWGTSSSGSLGDNLELVHQDLWEIIWH